MRAALWFLGLFGIAVAVAVFAGNNDATVTLYWPPYRVDLSLNFVILALVFGFALVYAAMRTAAVLFALPVQAKRWRALQKERAINAELFNAQSHYLAGRYIRSRKSALAALHLDKSREQSHPKTTDIVGNETQLRALAHVMVAQSAHALQDKTAREEHLSLALMHQQQRASLETREGTQLLAASWALDDRDATAAMRWLAQLPSGAARRTLALRIKLKAAQMENLSVEALDTTRLLAKHHAFSKDAAPSLIKSLVMKRLDDARDVAQLQTTWRELDNNDRLQTEVAIHAAYRLSNLNGNSQQIADWLLPAWNSVTSRGGSLSALESIRFTELIDTMETILRTRDLNWLAHVENAQRANPRDPSLQYLAGVACMSHQLWGKAQQQLAQATTQLQDANLKRRAWCALAELAEQRGEQSVAASAWKNAAQI
jgi:HemY protein